MVGNALLKSLAAKGYQNLVVATSSELDLTSQEAVEAFFKKEKPSYVFLVAAKVGGIQANIKNPAVFLYNNLMIQNNVIHAAYKYGAEKIVFYGSSCIYPKECPQPMKEEYLLTGKLEPTNEGYSIAKIAGIKMIEGYRKQYNLNGISLMPCNLYGPNDSFDLEHSHVLSALVKRFSDAKEEGVPELTLWGTGNARREFMHVEDAADAGVFLFENYNEASFINVGWGTDVSIKELAEMIAQQVGYQGQINWDHSKPDGMMRKCMDVSRMKALGFEPKISLEEGVKQMITLYQAWQAEQLTN
jgi:GDP-L-fucose synthase